VLTRRKTVLPGDRVAWTIFGPVARLAVVKSRGRDATGFYVEIQVERTGQVVRVHPSQLRRVV
jgi:hypothetical protein